MNSHYDYNFIEPKYLREDPSYQRDIDQARVNNIVRNFNDNIFNEPKVSKRDDGFYYIFDGGHSVAAHIAKFGENTPIKCKVFYGLTPDDEMQLFVQQNGISKAPTRIEKLRAMANHGDAEVLDMIESARIAGVTIEFKGDPGQNKIIAVDAAFRVYKNIGRNAFINMLCVIRKSWLGSAESYSAGMLKGFGYIYKHCADQMTGIPNKDMVSSFEGYPVTKITERANQLYGNADKRYAVAISEVYNRRKRSKRIVLPMR
jgi:hypothetical protein